ncbi:hypothetical protein ACFX2I_016222 [Malus domestica]
MPQPSPILPPPDGCDKAVAYLASKRSGAVVVRPRRHAAAESAFRQRNTSGVGSIPAVPEALKPKLEDQESELADARVWESCEGRQAKVAENTVVDKPKLQPFQVSQGHPSPLGATARDGGINFAFYSGNAEISKISFTDTNLMEKFSPDEGHYYDSSRIALDPYAKAVIRRGEFRKLGPDGNCWPQMAGTVLSFDDQKKQRQAHKEAQAAGERED